MSRDHERAAQGTVYSSRRWLRRGAGCAASAAVLAVVLSACFDLRTLKEQHADAIEDARRSAMAAGWMLGFAGTAVLALGRRAMWFVAPVVVVALLASSIAIDELDLAEYFRLLVEGS